MSTYEPPTLEIWLTLALGNTLLRPYYRRHVQGLPLTGDERVLDYGSGSGVCSRPLVARLARGGGRLTCVDVSETWQRVIQRTLRRFDNVDYALGAVQDLDIDAGSYDVVFIHFVLHDVPHPEQPTVVRALARVLQPGGRLLIREPADPGHGMTAPQMEALLTANGFELQTTQSQKVPMIGEVNDAVLTKPAA